VAESIEQLSFELTASALAEQERALSGLRARAGTVLAAASIAGSFLGAKTSHGSLGVSGVLAMFSFALCVGSAIWILLPHALVFAFRGEALLAESDHLGTQTVTDAYRSAGIWIGTAQAIGRIGGEAASASPAASCVPERGGDRRGAMSRSSASTAERVALVLRRRPSARQPQQAPSPRARAPGRDRGVLEVLAPRDQRFAVGGGREEAAVLGIGEAGDQRVGQRRRLGEPALLAGGFEQRDQRLQQEGVVLEVGVDLGVPSL
jgi:hypothetical protein